MLLHFLAEQTTGKIYRMRFKTARLAFSKYNCGEVCKIFINFSRFLHKADSFQFLTDWFKLVSEAQDSDFDMQTMLT